MSDRLLTDARSGQAADRRSNKALVLVTPDFIGTLGYSGSARLRDRWTDEWLAEALLGCLRAQEVEQPARFPSVHMLMERLRSAIDGHLQWLTPVARARFGIAIQLVGHRRQGHGTEGFAAWLDTLNGSPVRLQASGDGGCSKSETAWVATPDLSRELAKGLAGALSRADDPRAVLEVLLEAMARVAAARPGVGRDVLHVLTTPAGRLIPAGRETDPDLPEELRPITIAFLPGPQGHDQIDLGTGGTHDVHYSPWILSPWGTCSPTLVGPCEFGLPGTPLQCRVVGDPATELPLGLFAVPQPRKPDVNPGPTTFGTRLD